MTILIQPPRSDSSLNSSGRSNKFLDSKPSGQKAKELVTKTRDLLAEVGGVMNIFNKTPEEWYRSLMKVKKIEFSEEDAPSKDS